MTFTARTIAAVAAVVCGVGVWYFWPATPEPGTSAPLPITVAEVKAGPKVDITHKVKRIKASPAKIKRELGLSAPIQADDTQQVIATGKLTTEDRPYSLSAVLDTETGDTVIHAKADPLPWLARANQSEIAVGYVLKDSGQSWRLQARQDFIRSKRAYLYGQAYVDTDTERAIGLFGGVRF